MHNRSKNLLENNKLRISFTRASLSTVHTHILLKGREGTFKNLQPRKLQFSWKRYHLLHNLQHLKRYDSGLGAGGGRRRGTPGQFPID